MLEPIFRLCSANASWSKQGITVAGFANGTADSSLSGLHYPADMLVDSMGNMYIIDSLNYRILYWPMNSKEGRIVADSSRSDLSSSVIRRMAGLAGDDHYYCFFS